VEARLNYQAVSPEPVKAYYALGKYLDRIAISFGLVPGHYKPARKPE
jgi:hypothetical protein